MNRISEQLRLLAEVLRADSYSNFALADDLDNAADYIEQLEEVIDQLKEAA
jgi:hypothetical protein